MFVTRKSISRRTILRGAGTAIALPLLDAMIPAFAPAAATAPVRRFGVVYHPNGVIYDQWLPKGVGSNFELSPTLKGLEPLKDKVIVDRKSTRLNSSHMSISYAVFCLKKKKKKKKKKNEEKTKNRIR